MRCFNFSKGESGADLRACSHLHTFMAESAFTLRFAHTASALRSLRACLTWNHMSELPGRYPMPEHAEQPHANPRS